MFYSEPSGARRQRIHQQIAQTLERLYATNLEAHVLELAHHLVRAGPAAEGEKVIAYARRAGNQAFARFAWSDDARYYEAALAAAEATGQLSTQDRADFHYWAGLAHYRDQDAGPILDHYAKAIEGYWLVGDLRGPAWTLMDKTRIHYTLASVPYGTLVDVAPLEEVLDALGDSEPGLRGRISSILFGAYWVARQADQAEELAQQAWRSGNTSGMIASALWRAFSWGWRNIRIYARGKGWRVGSRPWPMPGRPTISSSIVIPWRKCLCRSPYWDAWRKPRRSG